MAFYTAVVMVRGNHLAGLPAVFELFDYRVKSGPTALKSWDQVMEALADPAQPDPTGKGDRTLPKAACLINGWTVILDPELIMASDDEPCVKLSRQLKSRVFALHCESTTGAYRYGFYEGRLLRVAGYVDGTLEEDEGPRQPEEGDLGDARDPAEVSKDDVLGIMQRTGVDYLNDLSVAKEYYLYELGALGKGKKPWWWPWA